MSFRKPCHMPFRKLIPPFTLTSSAVQSLLVQLRCNQNDMFDCRSKFLTIALSLKDIELGLEGRMESFTSIKLQSVAG